jgi:SlyX protein
MTAPPSLADDPNWVELTLRLAEQDDWIDALNLTVSRQQQRIDRLEREFAALSEQLQHSLRSQGIALDPAQEVPPHY